MPRKVFVAGEILTAADVNTNLMDQAVMVFDDATARATAIPTPVEGMVTYLSDVNQVQAFTGSAFTAVGGILQVVQTVKTDVFSSASRSFTPVTGATVTITPSSSLSKILIMVDLAAASSGGSRIIQTKLRRAGTDIYIGDAATGDIRAAHAFDGIDLSVYGLVRIPIMFLDSPSTTSSTTYSIEMRNETAANTFFVNRTVSTGTGESTRVASSLTVMEVAG